MKRALAAAVLLLLSPAAWAGEFPCPEGLSEAAAAHRRLMQEEAFRVRDATADAPRGVERVQVFDRVTHDCHDAPAQAYRVYGEGTCAEALPDGTVVVRYPFRLLYRKAESVEELFSRPWDEGSGGKWQVSFERRDGTWIPLGEREVLDLGGEGGTGPPGSGRHPGP